VLRLSDGRVTSIDFRETAPSAAGRDLFLDTRGNLIPGKSTVGYVASGVPGTVAGLALAEQKYGSGRLAWADLLEPARRLAAGGFAVTPALAHDLQASADLLGQFPESRRIYLRNGRLYRAGDRMLQPELAATLARLQQNGFREFYAGKTARLIAVDMAAQRPHHAGGSCRLSRGRAHAAAGQISRLPSGDDAAAEFGRDRAPAPM
jgi:gamma-glutamyltranspeptidase/glutathione hydrolase